MFLQQGVSFFKKLSRCNKDGLNLKLKCQVILICNFLTSFMHSLSKFSPVVK